MLTAQILAPRPTLVDRVVRAGDLLQQVLLVVAGSLLVALTAQIVVPLPFTPVPITGQTFGVLLVGASLGSRRGALSLLLYLLQGGIGLPVFASGASGWPVGPTGGYLLGFVLAAYVTGLLAEHGWERRIGRAIAAMCIGQAAIYAIGVTWLSLFVGWERVLGHGVLPFLPGDALKIALAALLLPLAWRLTRPRA